MLSISRYATCFCLGLVLPLLIAGCGGGPGDYPDMGSVYGTVTMDGAPLANASVIFQPDDAGSRQSIGKTDEDGYYELQYSATVEGAKVGPHTIRISTRRTPDPNIPNDEGSPESVPKRYNFESELKETVEGGSNEFNFELTSDGEIFEPEFNSSPDENEG